MNALTVFTTPDCQQCRLTTRLLDQLGHPYTVVSLGTEAQQAARERVADLGYTSAPVVVTADGAHWSGFRPERLRALTITPAPATGHPGDGDTRRTAVPFRGGAK